MWTLERLAALCDAELGRIDIAELNLCAQDLPGSEGLDIPACLRKLDEWADLIRIGTHRSWPRFERNPAEFGHSPGHFCILVMVTILQRDLAVRYDMSCLEDPIDFTDSRPWFLHGILAGHGGTCASLPMLYLAIGRRLGYPLRLVGAKEHLFVRWDEPGGERFNIECTSRGFAPRTDEYYHERPQPLTPEEIASGWFLRSLSPREELACCLEQRGHCLQDHFEMEPAIEAFCYTHRLVPENPYYRAYWAVATEMWHLLQNEAVERQPRGRFQAEAIAKAREEIARVHAVRRKRALEQASTVDDFFAEFGRMEHSASFAGDF